MHDRLLGLAPVTSRRRFWRRAASVAAASALAPCHLQALGASVEEGIATRMQLKDVTLFCALPRIPENVHLVIEAKRLGAGVEGGLTQGVGYVQALGVPRDVVVTEGIRYRVYDCQKNFAPVAYANLANLKASALGLFARRKRPY